MLRLLDDSSVENDPDTWTVEFQPYSGELSQATIYACPMGQPVGWPSLASQSGSGAPPMVSE